MNSRSTLHGTHSAMHTWGSGFANFSASLATLPSLVLGLRGPATPPDVLTQTNPARPPIDPILLALASAIHLRDCASDKDFIKMCGAGAARMALGTFLSCKPQNRPRDLSPPLHHQVLKKRVKSTRTPTPSSTPSSLDSKRQRSHPPRHPPLKSP
eukprot:609244-Pelagomonas_calceolata.AAC.1